jgi:integrase
MARRINRLTPRKVTTLLGRQERGELQKDDIRRHADGGNLYLDIAPDRRAWVFIYRWHGQQIELGLGPARAIGLARARALAGAMRAKLAEGINPKDIRKPAGRSTFGEIADPLIEAMKPSWRNAKHASQWETTLRDHAAALRSLPVDKVTTEDVLGVLRPIWNDKYDTASRLRGRIERVLDAAKAQGLRDGENPARWKGHLDQLLAKRQRVARNHHPAMPYADVPAFLVKLRARQATAALGLEFLILTAARSGEVLGARRDEFDIDGAIWAVPANRMKGGVAHSVPLSARALEIVKSQIENGCDFVFPGSKAGKPLSSMAFEMLLRRMKVVDATVHGFRSSFRDWAGDCTSHPRDVVEAALAHAVENRTEAAYRRSTAIEKRRALMSDWAAFCASSSAADNVVRFGRPAVASAGAP